MPRAPCKTRPTPRAPDKCGLSPTLSGILAPTADSAFGGFVRQVPPLPLGVIHKKDVEDQIKLITLIE